MSEAQPKDIFFSMLNGERLPTDTVGWGVCWVQPYLKAIASQKARFVQGKFVLFQWLNG